ncbi:uncharacterized protein LOC105029980 [Esox lucius]|uniref:uncharacterized protein LOC105029980 n=1 Tax=Esox lucius TaxID=8010 RepID=UPI001476DFD2|nr:uncharacterized protein LOC105029980 [Esox lucius]
MSPSQFPALMLLLVSSSWASYFHGGTMTFKLRGTNPDGTYRVELRYKTGFHSCPDSDPFTWTCASGDCGNQTSLVVQTVDEQTSGDYIWCQKEGVMTQSVSNKTNTFDLNYIGGNWIFNHNSVVGWRLLTHVDLGVRSDTGKANRSPQTTVIPLMRVPVNCQRDFQFLNFDPDGDEVRCRYAEAPEECVTLSNLSLDFTLVSCTLSFSSISNTTGTYVVQMVMEDFPIQSISLFYNDGTQSNRTSGDTLSKLPVHFAIRVDPAVPSCTEGDYLPMFLSPTPDQGAVLLASTDQPLEITVRAQATQSTATELLVSGPQRITKNAPSPGLYLLRWMPFEEDEGGSYPVCFIAQSVNGSSLYQSELRCVIISVGNQSAVTTTAHSTITLPPTTQIITTMTTNTFPTTIQSTTAQSPQTPQLTNPRATFSQNLTTSLTIDHVGNAPKSSMTKHIVVVNVMLSFPRPTTDEFISNVLLPVVHQKITSYGFPKLFTLSLIATHPINP